MAEEVEMSYSYVQLSSKHKPVHFDPVSANVNVFFDDANNQVFVVRSNGSGGIIVFEDNGSSHTYRIEDRGEISAVRLSPSRTILAVQRAPNALDFINFGEGKEGTPYCQTCKGKTTQISDFFWASDSEIIFVTDLGVEFYEVNADKKAVKCTKTISVGLVNWSLWHYDSKNLLISSGVYGNIIHPFHYNNGTLFKYAKFEIELAFYPTDPKLTLLRRDVIITNMYNQMYVVASKQDARSTQSAEIVLYKLFKDKPTAKSNILKLNTSGQFQVNIVDNLILVHHLQSKTTFLYDLKFASVSDQQVDIHQLPLVSPLPMKRSTYKHPFVPSFGVSQTPSVKTELYSSHWIAFQPDIIIDAIQGCMWKTEINLAAFPLMITDRYLWLYCLYSVNGAVSILIILGGWSKKFLSLKPNAVFNRKFTPIYHNVKG